MLVFMDALPAGADKSNPSVVLDDYEKKYGRSGKILSKKDITIDGHTGREIKILENNGNEMIVRFVVAYGRLYTYGVIEPGISEQSETYKTFFDNFKMKP